MARFLTSHCHFGSFSLPWHEDEASEVYPLCNDLLTHRHIFLQCSWLSMSCLFLFESAPCGHKMDLSWYVRAGQHELRRFLLSVRDVFNAVGVDEVV